MEEFPFTDAEWSAVSEAAAAIVNASAIEDVVLTDVAIAAMQDVLAELGERYGEHPVLIETAADFTTNPSDRARLYRRALCVAEAHGLETASIEDALRSLTA